MNRVVLQRAFATEFADIFVRSFLFGKTVACRNMVAFVWWHIFCEVLHQTLGCGCLGKLLVSMKRRGSYIASQGDVGCEGEYYVSLISTHISQTKLILGIALFSRYLRLFDMASPLYLV